MLPLLLIIEMAVLQIFGGQNSQTLPLWQAKIERNRCPNSRGAGYSAGA